MSGAVEVKSDDVTQPVNSLAAVALARQETREVFSEPASSTTDWHCIASPADILGRTLGDHRVVDTRAHREIYSILFGQLKNLTNRKYVDTQGVCCSLMVGAKGIGKTACLKSFTTLTKYICPNVFFVYLSYNAVHVHGSRLMSSPLSRVIREELTAQGLDIREDTRYELDQLYTLDGKEHPSATTTIHELAYFGNQPSGVVSVLACSSSSFMETLITASASAQLRSDFPLLSTGAIDLNDTKYRTKRVYSPLPTDLETVHAIVGGEEASKNANAPLYRLIAYVTGCSPSNVARLINEAEDEDQSLVLGCASPETCVTGADNTLANETASNLRVAVLQALVQKNRRLLRKVFGRSTLTSSDIIRNIATEAWEMTLQPLAYSDVERLWHQMEQQQQVAGDLDYYLLHLRDTCWLTLSGIRDSKPEYLYPFSLSRLADCVMSSHDAEAIAIQIRELVRKAPESNVLKALSNPQFVGRRTAPVVVTTIAVPENSQVDMLMRQWSPVVRSEAPATSDPQSQRRLRLCCAWLVWLVGLLRQRRASVVA
eukprot:gene12742-9109_t